MRKVLIVTSVASMVDNFLIPDIELLKMLGLEVHVACNFEKGSPSSAEKINGLRKQLEALEVKCFQIDFERSPLKINRNIKAYNQLHRLMKQNGYELVHCHTPMGGLCGRISSKFVKTKVIYTAHGFHFFKGAPLLNWMIYYPIEKLCARYTDCLITINNEDYENAMTKRFKAKKILHVPGVGIDLNKFECTSKEKKSDLRKKLGYTDEDFILIFVGELSHRKHQDMLINVVAELGNKIYNIRLLLVGSGELSEQYQNQIEELGLKSKVDLLGYRTDISSLMGAADVVVSSARQEGLPVNIMEGMATGLPVVVTNCRGNRDLVCEGENGFVREIDDTQGFSDAIYQIYSSSKKRISMGKKSTEMIAEYSLPKVQLQMQKIYLDILE